MQVLDLIQSAAIKSGVVSSFNIDDLPGDVLDMGSGILATQILPQINCDRTLDVTATCRIYKPVNGVIELKPLRQPIENFMLLGYSKYQSSELLNIQSGKWVEEIDRLYTPGSSQWPEDDFGAHLTLAIWSADMALIQGNSILQCERGEANIDFAPMRVDAVIDTPTLLKYTYCYRDEFETSLNLGPLPGIYAIEEYDDRLIVILKGTPALKKLILPVPLTIINRDHANPGTIIAPPKFEKFLIDATAYQLSVVYGMATKDVMAAEMSSSYNMLKKNVTQPLHGMNVCKHINDTIRNFDRRVYGNY